jgi:hypothetical protein
MRENRCWIFPLALCFLIFTTACSDLGLGDTAGDTNIVTYMARDIDNPQVHFMWIELPSTLEPGSNPVRVFMARTDPPGMLLPMVTELPCILEDSEGFLDVRSETLVFDYAEGQLAGSYTWGACASCVECYLDWDTRMEINARAAGESLIVSIGFRHMGHNILQDYMQVELPMVKTTDKEPRILCGQSECKRVQFVTKP